MPVPRAPLISYRGVLVALMLIAVFALGNQSDSYIVRAVGTARNTQTGALATVASIGGAITAIVVDGSRAYVAEGDALTILDIHDPNQPTLHARLPLHGSIIGLQVAGALAYALDYSTLSIVDVHDANHAFVLSVYPLYVTSARNIQLVGSSIYIAEQGVLPAPEFGFTGIEIVDATNPARPVRRSLYTAIASFTTMQVLGKRAYVAVPDKGLQILDVTDPAKPVILGGTDIVDITDVRVVGGLAYVTTFEKLRIIDISHPAHLIELGTFVTQGPPNNLQIEGHLAYILYDPVFEPRGIQVVDVGTPAAPIARGSIPIVGISTLGPVIGGLAYLALDTSSFSGIKIFDFSNPPNLFPRGGYATSSAANKVVLDGAYAYTNFHQRAIDIVDISHTSQPAWRGRAVLPDQIGGLDVTGGFGYATYGSIENGAAVSKLQVVDFSNPASPTLRGQLSIANLRPEIRVVGSRAYVLAGSDLQIIDIGNPDAPAVISSVAVPDQSARAIEVADQLVYIAGNSLTIVDISSISQPVLRGSVGCCSGNLSAALHVVGTRAYIAWGNVNSAGYYGGVSVVDVGTPAAPQLLGSYPSFPPAMGPASAIHVLGSRAYVAAGRLLVLDISDPSAIRELRSDQSSASDLRFADGYLFTTSIGGSLRIERVLDQSYLLASIARN